MEIRRNWKILVGIFICAIGIMFNGSVNAHATSLYTENRFEVMEEIDNPENYNGGYYAGEERNFTYKVTPKETGIYKIYSETDPEKEGYYNQNSLKIYAFNESKQVITTLDGIGIDGEKVYVEANIYMVKGKSYYIGFRTYDIEGKFVEVTMSKTNFVAQPKMKYHFYFDTYFTGDTEYVKGNYYWDNENATLTLDNCEMGPCRIGLSASNLDRPNGEKYFFAVEDFPTVKNIKVILKGENKFISPLNESDEYTTMLFVRGGNSLNNNYVNVGIEFTGGGTLNIDQDYIVDLAEIVGDIVLNDITLNINWEKSALLGRKVFDTDSNLKIINSTINAKLHFGHALFGATADIIVDDSQFCINAVWGDEWKDKQIAGIFYANDEVLLNSGELLIAADPEYLELLEKNKYCSLGMNEEGVEINKDKFTFASVNNVDISQLKYTLENTTYIYDGKAKTPKVTIPGLVEGKHFEVKYSDNVNVGKAKFTVTGIGMFTGKIEGTFEIAEKSVENQAGEDVNTETTLTDGKLLYKILLDASADEKTAGKVQVVGLQKKNLKKITIKAVVTLDGKKYNVTSIAANAFKGNKKITKVTIGKNVTTIGKKAFFGCKKLKTVKINSKKLKVGKKAFYRKGGKKLTIRVPKKLKKKYKKAFKKAKTNKFIVK
ncbi:Leucine rich repeat-containing protein [Eubacterium uniforme]|uniref:Leucine rich repeat-containing protein n=1 Tax=Eubacterium uniforme TaxID=39495 RepID=A0A1T4VD85_9FIRM|nr:leucine-rich repeat protein [Eubacterium uniforme]SKA62924.1 Leucine rich repeat-containing protein [Eubacterium uniforme]